MSVLQAQPKATLAAMAVLLRTSMPSMSAEGSLSAYPSSWARARTSANSAPSRSIASTMKLVVPFMMPPMELIRSMRRAFSMLAIQGTPPPQVASMRRLAREKRAWLANSSKYAATTALLEVTTLLPAARAERM